MNQVATREPQYAACFNVEQVQLGAMTSYQWRTNPKRVLFGLARYKFVAKMLAGAGHVAEIGCADGFASAVVAQEVKNLELYDFDPVFCLYATRLAMQDAAQGESKISLVMTHDITAGPLIDRYDAIYMLDVLEHIEPAHEATAMGNIVVSLQPDGVFIAGVPSLESQAYASDISRAGHVNCKTGPQLKAFAARFFRNVFLFGMNDEVVHTGFSPMCQYLFVLCTGPRGRPA